MFNNIKLVFAYLVILNSEIVNFFLGEIYRIEGLSEILRFLSRLFYLSLYFLFYFSLLP